MKEQDFMQLQEVGTILNYSPEIAINQNRATVRNSLVKMSFQFYPEENKWGCSAGPWYGTGDSPAKAYMSFLTTRIKDLQNNVTPWSKEVTRVKQFMKLTVDQVQTSCGANIPHFDNVHKFVLWLKKTGCQKPYVEWNGWVYDTKVVMEDPSKREELCEYLFEDAADNVENSSKKEDDLNISVSEKGLNPYYEGQHGAEEPEDTAARLALVAERDQLRERVAELTKAFDNHYFDFVAYLHRQIEFSSRTFGPEPRIAAILDHLRKELCEIQESPYDVEEWIDVATLALDGAWRVGATPEQIVEQLVAKLAKNENCKWPDWRTAPKDKAIEYDRTEE